MTLTGDDTVTLAAGSTTTGITVNLGAGDDMLNLASANFGTLDAGAGADTLTLTGTGVTLDGGQFSGFDTLTVAETPVMMVTTPIIASENTLTGAHVGLTNANFNTGVTLLDGSLTSAAVTIATAAVLNLADEAEVIGDLVSSGVLEVAGDGIGAATITGDLTLNNDIPATLSSPLVSGSTLSLDVDAMSGTSDMLTVSGAVTLGGTLAIRQSVLAAGTVTLIDGGTSLTGDFLTSNIFGLVDGPVVQQTIMMDTVEFDIQLVTEVTALDPVDQTHVGCMVLGGGALVAGGTLNCISGTPLTGTILTHVDGVTINVGSETTPTILNAASDSNADTSDDAIRALVGLDGISRDHHRH